MKIFKKIWLVLLLMPMSLMAQNDVQVSQHLFTQTHYNPALTGNSIYANITMLARHQFMDFAGAPTTGLLNFDILAPSINSGFGLSVIYDKYGPLNTYSATVNYAYHIPLGENHKLSFGLGAGATFAQYDASGNIYEQEGDPTEYYDKDSHVRPNVNFGIQYQLKNWTIGASLTHIQEFFMKENLRFSPVNYYLYTKYKFEVGRDWDIVPAISAHYNGVTVNEELSLIVNYTKAIWFGVAYRMSDLFVAESIVPMIGFNITDYVRLGYAYDFNLTHLQGYTSGTHELMLTIRFKTNNEQYKTPRFAEWD